MENTVLTETQIRARLFQGVVDARLRQFYETFEGLDYLTALANLRALTQGTSHAETAQTPGESPQTTTATE